jgi:quinone-modifying oxidoreductase subunit QmoB
MPSGYRGQDRRSGGHAQHHGQNRNRGGPDRRPARRVYGDLEKTGREDPFDVPYPLPEEMKVDESGKELDAEKQHEKYLEYNEGQEDILSARPGRRIVRCRDSGCRLASGRTRGRANTPTWDTAKLPDVITNDQFEEIAKAGKVTRPSDGKAAKSVVFVQSPGKGDDGDFAYAGAVTSMVALKQAKYVREDYDDGKAFIFYQHMRTPGLPRISTKAMQQDPGIFMTKGEVIGVAKNGDGLDRGSRKHPAG